MLAAVGYALAGLVLFVLLRPDPLLVARKIESDSLNGAQQPASPPVSVAERRGTTLGTLLLVGSHLVMVAVMTMTPIYMSAHGFSLQMIGMVIGFHVAGMYLSSLFTGVLVDKIGRNPMALIGGVLLLSAGLLAAFGPVTTVGPILMALIVLGIGWNFGLITGTTMIVDAAHPSRRAKVQGNADVFVALAGATGSIISGVVFAYFSYASLSVICGLIAAVIFFGVVLSNRVTERSL